jgi:hypothetical protein
MVNDAPGIDVCQSFERQTVSFLFLLDPGSKRLLYDPTARTLQLRSKLIDFVGKRKGDMGCNDSGIHVWSPD